MRRLLCVILLWMGVCGCVLGSGVRVPLIPAPCEIVYGEGDVVLPRECGVAVDEGIEAGRLLGVLAEAGVAARRVGGGETGWVRMRRGEVRNPL